MFRNIALITILSLALSIVTASEPITQGGTLAILPEKCILLVGEEMHLELSGSLPSEAVVTWDIDHGEVVSLLPGSGAVLVAPLTPSVITVYATITGTEPGRWMYLNRQCTVAQPEIMDI